MKKSTTLLPVLALMLPAVASAQQLREVRGLLIAVGDLITTGTTIVAAVALLVFFWGLVKFIYTTSQEGKAEGKNFMFWGLIALFVMVTVWGLVNFIGAEIFVHTPPTIAPTIPTFPRTP